MNTNAYLEPVLWRKTPVPHHATWWSSVSAEAAIEFGRFRMLLRRRQLLADGVPIEIGSRAFDLLLILLESDGALVTKEELLNRVWPDVVVSDENEGPLSINSIDLSAVDGGPEWGVKDGCPVSKLLNAKITLDATLAS
jgi:hypothetical protein